MSTCPNCAVEIALSPDDVKAIIRQIRKEIREQGGDVQRALGTDRRDVPPAYVR